MAEQVRDIGAVVPLALHDQRLRPDHFLGRTQLDGRAEYLFVHRVREPLVVHYGDAVARAVDHVDELVPVVRFRQPVGEGDLGLESGAIQHVEHALDVAAADEDVEVLGRPRDAGVVLKGVGAADHIRHAAAIQHVERRAIQLRLLGRGQQRSCGVEHSGACCTFQAVLTTGSASGDAGGCCACVTSSMSGSSTIRYGGRSGFSRASRGIATL